MNRLFHDVQSNVPHHAQVDSYVLALPEEIQIEMAFSASLQNTIKNQKNKGFLTIYHQKQTESGAGNQANTKVAPFEAGRQYNSLRLGKRSPN